MPCRRLCHRPAPTGTLTSTLGLGVWLQPLPAATRAASRSPRLEYALPRLQQRRHGHRPPSPRASLNNYPGATAVRTRRRSMWRIRARRVGPSLLLDRGREWQAQGQLPARGRAGRERGCRAGQCGRAERAPGRRDWQHHRY
eukprot:scaffold564_cov101-Isochrysis_galbana.AAC.1